MSKVFSVTCNTLLMWLLLAFLVKSVGSVLHPNLSITSAKPYAIQGVHTLSTFSLTPASTAVLFHPEDFWAFTYLFNYNSAPGLTLGSIYREASLPLRQSQPLPKHSSILISKPILTNVIVIIILDCPCLLLNDHLGTGTVALLSDSLVAVHRDFGVIKLRFGSHHTTWLLKNNWVIVCD